MVREPDQNQLDAINRLSSGSILCGGVGSGKTFTSLYYYFVKECGGLIGNNVYEKMKNPKNLYVITTAKKRDSGEWESDALPFVFGLYDKKFVVDSWNNISKYENVKDSFFIFDEQRLVGYGAWAQSFLKIAENNHWILLTATPGDTWLDYATVFIANGFYANITDFRNRHVIYNRYVKYPKVDRYINVQRLQACKNLIVVNMEYKRTTNHHDIWIKMNYDKELERTVVKDRWDIFEEKPIENVSQLCYILRKISNVNIDRIAKVENIVKNNPRTIIFYNFNYELDILKDIGSRLGIKTCEWNGHKHDSVPDDDEWIYLVQYTAGAEGWNCITTNVIVFYSLNYSYKIMTQAAGRIDRRNTPFKDLYYYYLESESDIDKHIHKTLTCKKQFNEKWYVQKLYSKELKDLGLGAS